MPTIAEKTKWLTTQELLSLLRVAARSTLEMPTQSPTSTLASVEGVNSRRKASGEVTHIYVPVVGSSGVPLMPCHPARARELVRNGRALRRFNKGIFYIRLLDKSEGVVQPIAVGVDPGSKKEGITIKSAKHTFLNIQSDTITWIKDAMRIRAVMRRTRRFRNTPYRAKRSNRTRGGLAPSVRSRWQWKLRMCRWLAKMYPISNFVVEDIKARTTGRRRWDSVFSPLEYGKKWFYSELSKTAKVDIKYGWDTREIRYALGLSKTKKKISESFYAHCVDSWVLANSVVGGHEKPENTRLLFITPLRFHRRQLHFLQPKKGGIRNRYGSTRSLGFKRGSLATHPKYGLVYIGGTAQQRISLHSVESGKRLCLNAKPKDITFLAYNSWRTRQGGYALAA